MGRFLKNLVLFALLGLVLIGLFGSYLTGGPRPQRVKYSYSEFLKKVEANQVKMVMVDQDKISGILEDKTIFFTHAPDDPNLVKVLKEHRVDIQVKPPSSWLVGILPTLLLFALIIGFWLIIMRQGPGGAGQAFSFGKNRAKLLTEKPKSNFNDVAGVEEAKEELKEVVEFLKNPEKFKAIGAKIPKGVLLLGPTGTGKTLLSRAVAGEADVPFFHMSGSDFVEMFVGVGASRVRDLFAQAKKSAPCLIFIDELDAVGRMRGAGLGGGHDEREQTLNQLLVEMDGFDPNVGVILLAATNRPDVLDPALLRPGRFDRHIVVDKPDVKGREAILKIHIKEKPLAEDVDLNVLARGTPGFSGADLANLINEAALLTARQGGKEIGMSQMEEAKDRVIAGPERKSRLISEREKKIIAYHEAGHALVSKLLPNTDPVHKISILPRGMALGYTMQLPLEDRYLTTKSELIADMTVMLGGRASEKLIFDEITTGAHNDLERVTEIARKMICEYGMSDKLGPLTLGKKHRQIFLGRDISEDRNYGEEVAGAIDKEVRRVVEECYQTAQHLLEENKGVLANLANLLMEKETLEGEELKKVLDEVVGEKR